MKKVRINELARELEVKAHQILEALPLIGVTEKKTHSSSVEEDIAERLRHYFATGETMLAPAEPAVTPAQTGMPVVPRGEGEARPELEPLREVTPAAVREAVQAPVAGTIPAPPAPAAAPEAPLLPGHPAAMPLRPPTGGHPLRPPVGSMRPMAGPAIAAPENLRSTVPAVEAPEHRAPVMPAKPLPTTLRPGEILTGPRQPFPPGPGQVLRKPVVTPAAARPAPSVAPAKPPAAVNLGAPAAAAPIAPVGATAPGAPRPASPRPRLAAQPAARPVVPPRPDLVARLAKALPARPGMPAQSSAPVPGQPIYRGPIRPGQPMVARTGTATPLRRPRGLHPTAVRLEPPVPLPVEAGRRPVDRRRVVVEREVDREGKILRRPDVEARKEDTSVLALGKEVTISEGITVKELAEKLGLRSAMVIKKLVEMKVYATINQTLEARIADNLARAFGATTTKMSFEEEARQEMELVADDKQLLRRAPVVTVMGHVDHGKTSLLDAIRETNVAAREAGGITQHIGACEVEKDGRRIVFIDTPGHEAFTRMRARGAKVTDIVILVVAADDGVMPQTLEAIDHARAADVPIVVALNKIDKPEAQPERVKQQLADRNLLAEQWGGDTVMVPVSAKTRSGIDLLLEMVLLVADLKDLKANPARPAVGTILEAQLDRGRGPVATVLVQNGTLHVGDHFICGSVFGRVRAMYNDLGQQVREAGPSAPVEVLGLESLPEVGDTLQVVTDTAKAKQVVIFRESRAREQALAKTTRLTLNVLNEQIRSGETKELPIIIKADVGGSAEVLTETLQKLSTDKVKVRVISSGVGAISESDVLLASTSNAVIIGFNVRPDRNALATADQEKVDIRLHTVIYELTEEVKKAMTGLLEPVFREIQKGRAEVRETFRITKVGTVAGCYVLDGTLSRDSEVRVLRDNVVVYTGRIASLRRFKDDVSEVKTGMECGVTVSNFGDVKPGDVLEAFVTERVAVEALV